MRVRRDTSGVFSVGQLAKIALLCLGMSIVSYGIAAGKEARGLGSICTEEDVSRTVDSPSSEQDYLSERLRRYRNRIDDNDAVIHFVEGILASGGSFLILSVIAMIFTSDTITTGANFGTVSVIFGIAALVGFFLLQFRHLPDRYLLAEGMLSLYLLKWVRNSDTESDTD